MIVPCIVCKKVLREVFEGETNNQPDGGVTAIIGGNYGSTVFDPFDGTHIEINICDECLVQAGDEGLVLSGRRNKPVRMERQFVVGYEEVNAPLVEWHRGLPTYDTMLELDMDEDLSTLPNTVHIDMKSWTNALKILKSETTMKEQ